MSRFRRFALAIALAMLAVGTLLVVAPSGGAARASTATPSPAVKHATNASSAVIACPSPYTQGFQKPPAHLPAGCPAPCPALNAQAPSKIGGLVVGREDPCGDFQSSNPLRALDAVALFSIREPNQLLIATLEVGRFSTSAPINDADFRDGVVAQIGSTTPEPLWLDGREVFATSTNGLVLTIWFKGRYLFILAVRNNYDQPKTILRDALKVVP